MGGSVINVLYPMVTGLDRSRFMPIVLFYWPHPYQEKLERAGVQTLVFDKPRRVNHPTLITNLQNQQEARVQALRHERSWRRDLYHTVGSYLRLSYLAPQILRLAQIIRECDVDLVHLNRDAGVEGREVVLAAKLAGRPVLCYAQNFSKFYPVDRQIGGLVDLYIGCSTAVGQHCIAHGGARLARNLTIYPGVADPEKWAQKHDIARTRQSFNWTPNDFVVGCIGRLVAWKGQDVFLKALAEVKREIPDIKGLIVGGGIAKRDTDTSQPSFQEELLALAQALGLAQNVHFTGFRDDIPALMGTVDILVHSSIEPEPFATTVIEGMMAGRPVIATNAGGMPEMINHGVTGLLVPPQDSQAMAQAILDYSHDRERMHRLALAGQQVAHTRLTAQRHIAEFEAVYARLLRIPCGALAETVH